MNYLIRTVWSRNGEIHSNLKETKDRYLAYDIFDAYVKLMTLNRNLGITRVSLYGGGYEIERRTRDVG